MPLPNGLLTEKDLEECWLNLDPATLEGKTIHVTGASGCIGGAVAEAISWRLPDLKGTKLFVSGRRIERLKERYSGTDAVAIELDLTRTDDLDLPRCDILIHAASPASPPQYLADPVGTLDANANGLHLLMRSLRDPQEGRVLFISSGEIYGSPDPEHVPTPETYLAAMGTLDPRACYTEAKRFGEAYVMAWHRQFGTRVVIARPIHVYGGGLWPTDGRVICDFLATALQKRPISMQSDGSPQRSFCYISDATRLHLALLLSGLSGEAVNVGREGPLLSIARLAEVVSNEFGPVEIHRGAGASPTGSPLRSCPSVGKARDLLGYEPKVELIDGLHRLAEVWRKHGQNQSA